VSQTPSTTIKGGVQGVPHSAIRRAHLLQASRSFCVEAPLIADALWIQRRRRTTATTSWCTACGHDDAPQWLHAVGSASVRLRRMCCVACHA